MHSITTVNTKKCTRPYISSLLLLLLLTLNYANAQVKINELMASNITKITDNTGEYSDWVELHNSGGTAVDLAGYYLSDDLSNVKKFQFTTTGGQVVIPANGYLLIWASGITSRGVKHTSFALSASGEDIVLTAPDGITIIDSFSFGNQRADVSYGRLPNGGAPFKYFASSTPGTANSSTNSYDELLLPPVFSKNGGFYQNAFSLQITSTQPGVTILYTIDGSEPASGSLSPRSYNHKNQYPSGSLITKQYRSYTYTAPIDVADRASAPNKISGISSTFDANPDYLPGNPVYKGTVVRARATKANALPSDIVTHSYFFTPNGRNKYSLPVISISTQENGFFDYSNGIYVAGSDFDSWKSANPSLTPDGGTPANYRREGENAERSAHIEIIEKDTVTYQQDVGIRINGGYSRAYRLKTLRIYATDQYKTFDYQLFPNLPFANYKTFLLRNSGQDYEYTMFRDAFIHDAVSHLIFDTQAYRPGILFLNGEYWGIHNLRQRQDKHYYNQKYGADPDNLDILSNSVEAGDRVHYNAMTSYISSHSMQTPSYYNYIKTQMDVENFRDYQISEIYFANSDWPFNNVESWRLRVPFNASAPQGQDGRWRWNMYDTDVSMGNWTSDKLSFASRPNEGSTFLLYHLLRNDSFKNDFINRFADLLNTAFLPSRLTTMLNERKNRIAPSMADHISRWRKPSNLASWETFVTDRLNFIQNRPSYQYQHIRSKFGIGGEFDLTVNVSDTTHGYVRVNSIDIRSSTPGIASVPYPWIGKYFDNIPFQIKAKPKAGFKFKHWEFGNTLLTDSIVTVNTASNVSYKAIFEQVLFSSNPIPGAFTPQACGYTFKTWSPLKPALTYPDSMRFVYMAVNDPILTTPIAGFTTGAYNFTTRTRITGLNALGVSFINTGNGNPGYPAQQLGGAILALNTTGISKINLSWKGRTMVPNSKQYRIRLQARVGDLIDFTDVLDGNGNPVEYIRSSTAGDSALLEVELPAGLLNQPYIQLLWRYYYTGVQSDPNSGARDELGIDDIIVKNQRILSGTTAGSLTVQQASILSTATLQPSADVLYEAKDYIELKPNFQTSMGTVFKAQIAGCN